MVNPKQGRPEAAQISRKPARWGFVVVDHHKNAPIDGGLRN